MNTDADLESQVKLFVMENIVYTSKTHALKDYEDLVKNRNISLYSGYRKLSKRDYLESKEGPDVNTTRKRCLLNRKRLVSKKCSHSLRSYLKNFKYSPAPRFTIDADTVVKVHKMWTDYANSIYKQTSKSLPQSLIRMDFHGAPVCVGESRNNSIIGTKGVVVMETQHTLTLWKDGKLNTLPKAGSDWTVTFPGGKLVTFRGDSLCYSPALRLTKKFKKNSFW